jgi:8-oxo-dGTP pyrophosphatase MutT (NUDIX family)
VLLAGEIEDIIKVGISVMRQRGTALVIKHGNVLLVRDKGSHKFSLPGGGIHEGEPTVSAAARELFEELGLHVTSVKRLRECDFKGAVSVHKVCLVEADGEPKLKGHELDNYIWWDMKSQIPVYAHVTVILKKFKK